MFRVGQCGALVIYENMKQFAYMLIVFYHVFGIHYWLYSPFAQVNTCYFKQRIK